MSLLAALAKGLDELYGGAQKGSQTLAQEIGSRLSTRIDTPAALRSCSMKRWFGVPTPADP